MPGQDPDLSSPVGGPLFLAEARYLQRELARLGVKAEIRPEPSPETLRGRVHVVLVSPEDLDAAQSMRDELLDEPPDEAEAPEVSAQGSDPGRHRARKSALVLGVLGFVTGFRVGSRALGSVWLGIVLAAILSAMAFCVTRMFFQSPREGSDGVTRGDLSRDGSRRASMERPSDSRPPTLNVDSEGQAGATDASHDGRADPPVPEV